MSKQQPFARIPGGGSASAPQARGGGTPLDKMGSRVSQEDTDKAAERRAERRRMREVAGKLLSTEAVSRCGKYTGRGLEVAGKYASPIMVGAHGAYFGNIVTCKSVWHCAVCAAKIAEERRREIAHVVAAAQEAGCNTFMITLTQGHKGFHEPEALRRGIAKRWQRMLAGKAWHELQGTGQVLGCCRALEVTHGKNGWHPHLHVLIFFGVEARSEQIGRVLAWLAHRWVRFTLADGYECSADAQDIRDARTVRTPGDYVSKFGVDWEMSHAHLKKGRGGRAPLQILADYIVDDSPRDADLFKQYGGAFKGARQLTWSGKIRRMFPQAQKEAAKAIYRKDDTSKSVCIIVDDTMRDIDNAGIRELILDTADEFGLEGVLRVLRSHGVGISGVFPASLCEH